MNGFFGNDGPIVFVPETDNPNFFYAVKNPNYTCMQQIVTFEELHEYFYKDEYKYLFF